MTRAKQPDEFKEHIGKTYGRLTVVEILPRVQGPYGRMKQAEALCKCECGNMTTAPISALTRGKWTSCGCAKHDWHERKKGQYFGSYVADKQSFIAKKLNAQYECPYPTADCVRSIAAHICCHECDREEKCGFACQNTSYNCDAKRIIYKAREEQGNAV